MRFQLSHVVVCAGALGVAGCAGDGAEMVAPDDAACASCHVFGDFDSLTWDLGDPE